MKKYFLILTAGILMSPCAPKDNGRSHCKKQVEVEVIKAPEVSVYKITDITVDRYDERLAVYVARIASKDPDISFKDTLGAFQIGEKVKVAKFKK